MSSRSHPVGFQELESRTAGAAGDAEQCRQALQLWIEWNAAHERLCAEMYQAGRDLRVLEEKMDHVDSLRRRALKLSRELLRNSGPVAE